jgi:sporulation protein YlmC with PRC-barrel domain
LHVAVPWRWVRAIDEVVLLRWFPPTPIPMNS